MNFRLKYSLAFKLVLQLLIVIVIISSGFYAVINLGASEMRKRIFDKARFLSLVLGVNLDKIVADNLAAQSRLQEAVVVIARANATVEELQVITSDFTVLASSSGRDAGRESEASYRSVVREVIDKEEPRSIVKTVLGRDLVVHFMPLFSGSNGRGDLIAVMQAAVAFPSQQGTLVSSLRADRYSYFRKEAAGFAENLSGDVLGVLKEARRNFNYLEDLVKNMTFDDEIHDVRIYAKDLLPLVSGAVDDRPVFMVDAANALFSEVMVQGHAVSRRLASSTSLEEFASPLYLTKDGRKEVSGAVGIVLSLKRIDSLVAARRNNILILSLIIAAVACLVIGLFFKRRILGPIGELIALTEKIGRGDFSQSSRIKTADEMGRLSEAFNRMAQDLKKSKHDIEEFNFRLQEKVDAISQELKKKQAQLLESEKLASLGILSSGIAHEINNPLGIILGHTQLLLKEVRSYGAVRDAKEAEALLRTIEDHTKRCTHIVKSLLDFSRKKDFQLKETDMKTCLENALAFTQSRLIQKNVQVTRDVSVDIPPVRVDQIQMEQVFINLILNAEQSMADGGRLKITTIVEDFEGKKAAAVTFEDTGEGILPENIPRVFDPFFSTKEPGEGAGLGLSVSYGIVKGHGGDIEVRSKVGQGTTVVVRLPYGRDTTSTTGGRKSNG
jgi:signal transduction histidine kinase